MSLPFSLARCFTTGVYVVVPFFSSKKKMHLVSVVIIAVEVFKLLIFTVQRSSESDCSWLFRFVWCFLPWAQGILPVEGMGCAALASNLAPVSKLGASSLRHPGNKIC